MIKKNRIKFAHYLNGWKYDDGNKEQLQSDSERIMAHDYLSDMKGNIFCPVCFTDLSRKPHNKDHLKNGRDAYFSHLRKYKNIKCDLRTNKVVGKKYLNEELARQAISDDKLVIISDFLQERPVPTRKDDDNHQDQFGIEDIDGEETEIAISRHNGESFSLPSKITTISGICRNFSSNIYKYYHFPNFTNAMRLLDILHNIEDVIETDDKPKLYFGTIISSYSSIPNPQPHNIRMTKLKCNSSIKDFYLKLPESKVQEKRITEQSTNRIILMYGKVTKSGLGLSIERLAWGEFALLPEQYNSLLK